MTAPVESVTVPRIVPRSVPWPNTAADTQNRSAKQITHDYPLRTKETLHRDERIRIGRAAAELVQPGETIILDSGTTTAEVARHLKRVKVQSLTVITNALNIAVELADAPGISLIMIGGLLRPVACSFVGPQAEAMMNEFHADRLFL